MKLALTLLQYKNSLVIRLMLAFMFVAVIPVLIASEASTWLATQTFNKAIEDWLRETMEFTQAAIKEAEQDLEGGFVFLLPHFIEKEITFTPDEITAMRNIDVEHLWVRDANGGVLYTSTSLRSIDEKPLYVGGNIRWITTANGERRIAFVIERTLLDTGYGVRTVYLAEEFNSGPFASSKRASLLSLRIFVPQNGGFKQVYASRNGVLTIPEAPSRLFYSGADEYFIPDKNWTDGRNDVHLFFKVIRDTEGVMQALLVCGAAMGGLDRLMANSTVLFWGLFFGGVLVSCPIGYVLAQRIVKPIKDLDAGLNRVAAGQLGYEIPVSGGDEIARLGLGFNMMSRRLEAMQKGKEQSAKRERTQMLGEIALGFAHEIRNPLLVIKTSAEVLHNRLPKDTNDTRLLGFIVEEVERINTLISEFLGFAKPVLPNMTSESLASLVDITILLCQAKFAQQGIVSTLRREVEDDSVCCDAKQIQQVLLNLLLNAADAMPDGGELSLRVYADTVKEHDAICLDIVDTGCGISTELLPTIHLPFVTTKEKGLGLGLSKVYAIIEEHEGKISCASTEGHGTTFTMCLKPYDKAGQVCIPF